MRAPLDLPSIYGCHEYPYPQGLGQSILEETTRIWGAGPSPPLIPGWSSDWSKFSNIHQWVVPYPRWNTLDKINDRKISCVRVRLRLGTLAEIIPVLYDETDHYRVLFRIGNRLYYCKSRPPITDDDIDSDEYYEDDDFDELPYSDILGLLPISYSQFIVADVRTITRVISDHLTQRNIDTNLSTNAEKDSLDRIWMYNTVKDELAKYCGKYPGDEILKMWTKEEWKAVRWWSVGIGGEIPSNCRIAS